MSKAVNISPWPVCCSTADSTILTTSVPCMSRSPRRELQQEERIHLPALEHDHLVVDHATDSCLGKDAVVAKEQTPGGQTVRRVRPSQRNAAEEHVTAGIP